MQTFQFQITQQYVSHALKIITPYWVEVNYEVVDNKVANVDVRMPLEIARYLVWDHLEQDIYCAAENNALSYRHLKTTADFMTQIFDHFKLPVS